MRLDVFLPVMRPPRPDRPPRRRSVLFTVAQRMLPPSLFSNWRTKQRGWIRRGLRVLGASWLAAPARRITQTICFVAFLVLFFHVCWPYDAIPARHWAGCTPVEVDAATGNVTVAVQDASDLGLPNLGATLFVSDAGVDGEAPPLFGRFRLVGVAPTGLRLAPATLLTDETLAALALSPGPWTLGTSPAASWPSHFADNLARKERIAAEFFLIIDPLVSLSTSIASRAWVWSLTSAGAILLVCVLIPRGFCGYLCPLGTLIDLFDSTIGKRITRWRVPDEGWWVHVKYFVLLGVLVAAACGVLLSGFVSAIPVITRGLLFTLAPLQNGAANGWHQVPPMNAGHALSLVMFLAVLGLGFLKPRFWCKYVCPSGAVFSLGNLFRASERKVESSCIHCNKCVEVCPFDAIKPDFTTRVTDCTLCQTCGGVCPTHAIKFVGRWEIAGLKATGDPPTGETPLGRRGFISAAAGTLASVVGGTAAAQLIRGIGPSVSAQKLAGTLPIRPPGSVPEEEFLQKCIRCGECFKACPSDVLQPLGFERGWDGLWTPQVVADWAGCASSCNACGQVCPTGAIRALPLEEKRQSVMGLAIVDSNTCLPLAGLEACQLCVDECHHAGYHAIEFTQVGTRVDEDGNPIEGTGFLAPVVLAEKCVGCGLCQTRCYGINVTSKKFLTRSAIVVKSLA